MRIGRASEAYTGIAAVIAALIALPAAVAGAETAMIPATRDSTLIESATGALGNGSGTALFVGRTSQQLGGRRRALLHFDVAGAIPVGMLVTRAELSLVLTPSNPGLSVLSLYRVLADWGEGASASGGGGGAPAAPGDATWIHTFHPDEPWERQGGDFVPGASAGAAVGSAGPYFWGPTPALVADVQAWLDAPAGNYGWILIGDEGSSSTAKRFHSRESVEPDVQPVLIVEYAPPCEAVSLRGAAGGLCIAYCEAMDCDAAAPNASARACDRLASRFARHSGGAPPPCVHPALDGGGFEPGFDD
jgi:hypothetical protein